MLTPRQERFVEEYLIDLNATQTAIRAGYSARTARQIGARNLAQPEIAAAVQRLRDKRSEETEATETWIVEQLVEIVKRAMTVEPVRDEVGKPTGVFTYQGNVANRALELLGKHRGMFMERREISGNGGGPVEHRVRVVWEGRNCAVS